MNEIPIVVVNEDEIYNTFKNYDNPFVENHIFYFFVNSTIYDLCRLKNFPVEPDCEKLRILTKAANKFQNLIRIGE